MKPVIALLTLAASGAAAADRPMLADYASIIQESRARADGFRHWMRPARWQPFAR